MKWICKRGLFLREVELEVARVHADVCVMGGQSQDRASAWHCTLLEAKGKKIKGLGISYLGIHSRNNVVIELLRGAQPIWELLVSCLVGFVLWFGFFLKLHFGVRELYNKCVSTPTPAEVTQLQGKKSKPRMLLAQELKKKKKKKWAVQWCLVAVMAAIIFLSLILLVIVCLWLQNSCSFI